MGLARFLEPKRERINSISGTTRFMAPEVLAGENYDFTAGLWSLGKKKDSSISYLYN